MADPADYAGEENAVHERAREAARLQRLAQPVIHSLECERCDEPIPLARRQAMADRECIYCVECLGQIERRGGRG